MLQQSLKQATTRLHHRVEWSLQKHRFLAFACGTNGLTFYRLVWMRANLQSLLAQLDEDETRKLSYDQECQVIYDNRIDAAYLDPIKTKLAHEKLEKLLPRTTGDTSTTISNTPLHERFHNYTAQLMIPKRDYQPFFLKLVGDILAHCATLIPELKTARVQQEYMDDINQSLEAYVTTTRQPRVSKMVVNIARGITYVKAQQLAVHELAHHIQQVLMEDHLYVACPELRLAMERGPLGILLEGGAEFFVELYYNDNQHNEREKDLESRMPSDLARRAGGVDKIVAVDRVAWFELWSTHVRITRDFGNGKISKEEAARRLLQEGLVRNDALPNADFMEQVGAYSHGFGYGKELIKAYCPRQAKNQSTVMDEYIVFLKRPLTPSQLHTIIAEQDSRKIP